MANEISLDTADRVEVVGIPDPTGQLTCIALEAIEAGAPCRIDPTTGKARNGNGTDMTEGRIFGVALKSVAAGEAVTLLRRGILDGFDLSGMNYGTTVYVSDTDARLSTVTGTKGVVIGYVVPGNAALVGASPEKLLYVDVKMAAEIS